MTRLALVSFLLAAVCHARREVEICGTHPERAREERALHERSRERLARERAKTARAAVRSTPRDMGNIVVMDASDGVVARRNPFNLDRKTLRLLPTSATAERYRYETVSGGYDASVAAAGDAQEGLGDDDARDLALPFPFPFYGASYSRVFLNSDGNLTFGSPDSASSDRSLGRMTAGPPRISPFFADMDPTRTGASVRYTAASNRATFSWVNVPEFQNVGTGAPNTYQVSLYPDGRIEMAWQGINGRDSVVGIAPGSLRGGTEVVGFETASPGEFRGAVVERFSSADDIDIVFAAQKFYESHDDIFDYVVVYNTLGIPAGAQAVAFEVTARNPREGIGDKVVDEGAFYGSARRLQAVLNMGPLSQYPRDPNAVVPARFTSRDTPLTVLGHEVGHLWMAYVSVREPGNPDALPMLGRQSAHWAFTFDSEASLLEGNRIRDNGEGTFPRFTTVATVEGYSPLDQYLMGLREPAEVPPVFYVLNPSIGTGNRSPQSGVSFNGIRRDVTIEELVQTEGRRVPDSTVSQRRFRLGFILVTPEGGDPSAADLEQLDAYRREFEPFFERATGGRATAETSLRGGLELSVWPASGVVAGGTATATVSLTKPATAAMTVLLKTQTGAASMPGSVTIAAGQRQATFAIRGERPGVEDLVAESQDSSFAPVHARIQVAEALTALRLVAVSGDKQPAPGSGALPQPLVFKVTDANGLPYPVIEVAAAVTEGGSVRPARATADASGLVQFTWTPGPGPAYEMKASLVGAAAVSASAVALGKPVIAANGVVNGASFRPGVTPGGMAAIFGLNLAGGSTARAVAPYPSVLGNTQVFLNGLPAQLIYVSDRQVNFLVPETLAGSTVDVTVASRQEGARVVTPAITVPVRTVDPGIYYDPASNLGAVLFAGSGMVTTQRTPAAGDLVEIYCTGLGPVRSLGGDLFGTVTTPVVRIGGRDADVAFSGRSPEVLGLYQVNAKVPVGLAAGMQTVEIRMGDAVSNAPRMQVR
ncbi:MAG: hypothetical protein U0Q16_27245 [Bryobacteraceae bacterium]